MDLHCNDYGCQTTQDPITVIAVFFSVLSFLFILSRSTSEFELATQCRFGCLIKNVYYWLRFHGKLRYQPTLKCGFDENFRFLLIILFEGAVFYDFKPVLSLFLRLPEEELWSIE